MRGSVWNQSTTVDLSNIELNELFDHHKWSLLKSDHILIRNISEGLKRDKQTLDKYIYSLILNKFNKKTTTMRFIKTSTGYTLARSCENKNDSNCKERWKLKIFIDKKEAHLFCENKCNHTVQSVDAEQSKWTS